MKNLVFLFLLALALLNSCNVQEKKEKKQPNFIVFIADDAAWNECAAYGNKVIRTPNINKLAEEGLVFDNAFLTASSCSPSRCSILTGRYPHSTGAPELHMPLPHNQVLFAGELQKAGYYTAVAGKYHIGDPRPEFDTIYGGSPSGCEFWVEAMENRPKEKPFFMWMAAMDPHRPYKTNTIAKPHDPAKVIVPPYLPDNDSTRKDLALYYDEISRLDSYLGKVLQVLKDQGEDENTLIIYMTDNGRPFPRAKTRLYDSGIKTPFIVRWPAKIKKGRTNALISSIDIAPTFCELAGLNSSPTFQGVSFVPVLNDYSATVRDHIAGEHNWHDYQSFERAIRNTNFLYIRNTFPELNASPPADAVGSLTYQEMIKMYNAGKLNENQLDCFIAPRQVEELYDVVKDPYQFNNLAKSPEYEKTLTEMRNKLDDWIIQYNDTIPENPTPDKFDRWTGKRLLK
ncbi:sulfatase family protein [Maribellus maritimus]|uniref:sulfatase family protein n=1 Tax=Maribellus maritimus TaxID=2870838 RepID=UPI001EEA120C|nr:sulfatase [Maribellus maritimus]MCG6188004.1 sulfatase [Maribellus maritimus]